MYVRHVGQINKVLMVSDSYLQVHDNYDNYAAQTGLNAPLTYEEFATALAAASTYDTTLIVDKAVAITDDTTIPATVHLVVRIGGSFTVATGKTLTISGTVDLSGQEGGNIFLGAGTTTYTTEQFFLGKYTFEADIVDGNSSMINIEATPIHVSQGARQGALKVSMTRYVAMTGTDGNSDIGFKCTVTNRAAGAGFNRVRAMEVTGDLRDAGSSSQFVEGAQFCAKTRSGTVVVDVTVARFLIDHGANGSGNIIGIHVQDVSQSATGIMYGILLNTSNYNIAREFGIFIDSGAGSWANAISLNGVITNVLDFEAVDGTNGFYVGAYTNTIVTTDPDAYIEMDGAGTPYFIPVYATRPA